MPFHKEPMTILPDAASLIAAINDPALMQREDIWDIKSLYLCDLIERIKAEGNYPYNTQVAERAIKELNCDPAHQRAMKRLVYDAQRYVAHDNLVADGFVRFTDAVLQQAIDENLLIQLTNGDKLKPKKLGTCWVAAKPHARNRGYVPDDTSPVRLIPAPRKAAKQRAKPIPI